MSKKTGKVATQRVKIESLKPVDAPSTKTTKPATVATEPAKETTVPKKRSALAAAVKVLAEAGQPLNAKEIVERMAKAGLWKSPSGKTPWATLSAALQRSLAKQGHASPFRKAGRGKFTVAQ